jgi:hypothetical protein
MLAGQIGARGRSGTSQVLQNSFPNQVVRYREVQGTCTGDVLDVVPLRWATRAKWNGASGR